MTAFSSLVRGEAKESRSELAQMLIESRLEAGFTQAEIAQLMFTSKSTVTRMESGRELPTLTTLEKWAEVTGKRLDVRFL